MSKYECTTDARCDWNHAQDLSQRYSAGRIVEGIAYLCQALRILETGWC